MEIGIIIWFIVASLINVMLTTAKSIFTIKGTKTSASIINAITFSVYTVIIKQVAVFDITISVIIIAITNLVGVWLAMTLIEKLKKDTLWKIDVVLDNIKSHLLINDLDKNNIAYYTHNIIKKESMLICLEIYSENQKQSITIKNILKKHSVKYFIIKTDNKL